jgi:hypothetical protein
VKGIEAIVLSVAGIVVAIERLVVLAEKTFKGKGTK